MDTAGNTLQSSDDTVPRLPSWVTTASAEAVEDVVFLSGAALSHLHVVLDNPSVPHALLRERLALRAAEACVTFAGRSERASDLRDTIHLLRPGALPGPAGETYRCWRFAVERPVSVGTLHRALSGCAAPQIAVWLDVCKPRGAGQGTPVRCAARLLEAVLTDAPRADMPALILADAALAQASGWNHLVPLLATGFRRADLRKRGNDLRLACHRAVTVSVVDAVRQAANLARRTAHLTAVAPKLRAKGAGAAVEMFLTQDAVAPGALPLPDRAARRLCDRLVALGGIRELTGRDTFRLYGV